MKFKVLILTTVLLVAPVRLHAQPPPDYCLSFPPFSYTLVGKGFRMPAKGRCAPWVGFSPLGGWLAPSSGTACVSSDGSTAALTLTTSFDFVTLWDAIALSLPSGQGEDEQQGMEIGQAFFAPAPAQGAVCAASANPIPNVARSATRPRLLGLRQP